MKNHKSVLSWLVALFVSTGAANLPAQTNSSAGPTAGGAAAAPMAPLPAPTAVDDQTVQLSPFVVQSQNAGGYGSDRTLGGTRTSADIIDLSTAVTVLNPQLISDMNAEDVQHLVGLGLAGVTQNQWIVDDVMIRGFRANYSMRDGVTQNSYSPTPMYDIERVEAIEGPSAMVMGDNTFIGGALNFISRAPTANPKSDVVLTATTDTLGVMKYRLQANNSGPLFENKEGMTAYYRVTVGGYQGNADHPEEDFNEKFVGAALTLYPNQSKNSSLNVEWHYFINNNQNYFDDFLDQNETGGVAKLSPYSTRTFTMTTKDASVQKMNEDLLHATFLTKIGDYGNLRFFFSYVDYSLYEAQVTGYGWAAPYMLKRSFGNYFEKDYQTTVQADYVDKRDFSNGFLVNTFTAGIDYRQFEQPGGYLYDQNPADFATMDVRNPGPAIAGDDAAAARVNAQSYLTSPLSAQDTLEYLYTLSYYVEERLSFWQDRIFVSGGYRWYHARATNQDFQAGSIAETDYAPFTAENLGIVLKPLPWLSVYYSHVTTTIPVAGYGVPLSGPNYPFQPSAGKDNEVGLKLDWRVNDRLSLHGSIDHFYEELTNVRTPVPGEVNAQTGVPVILQSASNNSHGMEVYAGARLSLDWVDFDLIATTYRGLTTAAQAHGGWANNAVGNTFSLLGKFTITHGPMKGLYAGMGGYQTGVKYEQPFIISTPNLYNSFAGYDINKYWSVQVNWDNMTDKRYINETYGTYETLTALPGEISFSTRFHW
jgi:outer membrane receptor for monomeric catechols